jgi:cell division protein FtsI (penicillin-binding protein 3)
MKIEGLEFIPEHRRTYPRDFLASQLLGSVGGEGTGLTGLEYSLDDKLRGADGERRLVKDALGEAIELRETRHTVPGDTIRLTIDEAIQDKAEEVLADVGATWHPHAATAIVMDPRTGALLALANWPRVDANKPGNAPDFARQNRAVGTTYEPGSTFKPFTVAGALEDHKVTPQTKFNLPPTIRLYDREIGESHPRGPVSLRT